MADYSNFTSRQQARLERYQQKMEFRARKQDIKASYAPMLDNSVFMNPYSMPIGMQNTTANPMNQMSQMLPMLMQFFVMQKLFEQMGMGDFMSSNTHNSNNYTEEVKDNTTIRKYEDGDLVSQKITEDEEKNTTTTINKYKNHSIETITEADGEAGYTKTVELDHKTNAIKVRLNGSDKTQGFNNVKIEYKDNQEEEHTPDSISYNDKEGKSHTYNFTGDIEEINDKKVPIYKCDGKEYYYTSDGVLVQK